MQRCASIVFTYCTRNLQQRRGKVSVGNAPLEREEIRPPSFLSVSCVFLRRITSRSLDVGKSSRSLTVSMTLTRLSWSFMKMCHVPCFTTSHLWSFQHSSHTSSLSFLIYNTFDTIWTNSQLYMSSQQSRWWFENKNRVHVKPNAPHTWGLAYGLAVEKNERAHGFFWYFLWQVSRETKKAHIDK